MRRSKAAAKSRRVDPLPGLTLNLEVLGVALLCLAAYMSLSLVWPSRAGWVGPALHTVLATWFGAGAWLAILALAVVAVVIFLEIHVLRMMGVMAACAAGAFLAIDAALGMRGAGGGVGNAIAWLLTRVLGSTGADLALALCIVAFVVVPTGISLKKLFGWVALGA